ncbi:MAG: Rv2993c-like domain-containing protein [Betaproteobacteria bacterium]
MKIARFSVDGWESYGRVEGDTAFWACGTPSSRSNRTGPISMRASLARR